MEQNHLKLYNNPNSADFLVTDIEDRPNRFTCFIKFKLKVGEREIVNTKCSGVLIADDCLLTAAHGVTAYLEGKKSMDNLHIVPEDQSQVKLALHEGTSRGRYTVKAIRKSKHYDNNMFDYALLQLQSSESLQENDASYPPVLAASPETMAIIKDVSLLGYPIKTNEINCPTPSRESNIFMSNQYQSSGPLLKFEGSKVLYDFPTQEGFSGGPIFAEYKGQQVVIGVHKASMSSQKTEKDKGQHNFGVNARQMLEELNEWGYELHKKPFVFTEKTLLMREFFKDIKMREVLSFIDKRLEGKDLRVMMGYEWNRLKIINLSGNSLGEEGFICLTNRKFDQLQSLSLEQNAIKGLEQVPEDNWRNLSMLVKLSLNLNSINSFPLGISLLQNMQHLGLAYNQFKEIPDTFLTFCRARPRPLTVTLYKNKIRDEKHLNQDKRRQIGKTHVRVIWVRQGELRQDKD